MCNFIHPEHTKLEKKEGIGWKLVYKEKKTKLFQKKFYTPLMGVKTFIPYKWIKWDNKYIGDGFCFFLTRNKARRALELWNTDWCLLKAVIKKIQYKDGLVEQDEEGLIGGYVFKIALCKEFKIID